MADLPRNTQYGTPASDLSTSLERLSAMRRQGGTTPPPAQTAPKASPTQTYSSLLGMFAQPSKVMGDFDPNKRLDIETPVSPVSEEPRHGPIPLGYSGFVDPGRYQLPDATSTNFKWGTPDSPLLSTLNIAAGATDPKPIQGQYVLDSKNPTGLVKSNRSYSPEEKKLILGTRSPDLYQIDHIIPLWVGGADTLANKQVLPIPVHENKTKAQAVAYTLLASGKIGLNQARMMALTWQDKDISDVPDPDSYGLLPIATAQQIADKWERQSKQVPEPSFKEYLQAVPEATRDLGKSWAPSWLRSAAKGAISSFTFGWDPAPLDEDASTLDKVAYAGGAIAGALAPINVLGKLNITAKAFRLMTGAARAAARKAGFAGSKAAAEAALEVASLNAPKLGLAGRVLNAVKSPYTEGAILYGQATPQGLAGMGLDTETREAMGYGEEAEPFERFFTDLGYSVLAGAAPMTLRGAAAVAVPTATIEYLRNPNDPMNALITAGTFGGIHYLGGKAASRGDMTVMRQQVDDAATRAANNTLYPYLAGSNIPPELQVRKLGSTEPVPEAASYTPERVEQMVSQALTKLDEAAFIGKAPLDTTTSSGAISKVLKDSKVKFEDIVTASKAGLPESVPVRKGLAEKDGMDLQEYLAERGRIIAAGRQLYKRGLPEELRGQADMDDLLSFADTTKRLSGRNPGTPAIADDVLSNMDDAMLKNTSATTFDPETMRVPNDAPIGDIPLTGLGVDGNLKTAAVQEYMQSLAKGQASPWIALFRQPELAPIFRKRDQVLEQYQIENGYTPDPSPEQALSAWALVWKEGEPQWVNLGWAPRWERIAAGGRKNSFNNRPIAKDGKVTFDENLNNSTLSNFMDAEGVPFLFTRFKTIPESGPHAKISDRPYITASISPEDWAVSLSMAEKLRSKGVNPATKQTMPEIISGVRGSMNAKDKSAQIQEFVSNFQKPAAALLDPEVKVFFPNDPLSQEITFNWLTKARDMIEKDPSITSKDASAASVLSVIREFDENVDAFLTGMEKAYPNEYKILSTLPITGGLKPQAGASSVAPTVPQTSPLAPELSSKAPELAPNVPELAPQTPGLAPESRPVDVRPAQASLPLSDKIASAAVSSGVAAPKAISKEPVVSPFVAERMPIAADDGAPYTGVERLIPEPEPAGPRQAFMPTKETEQAIAPLIKPMIEEGRARLENAAQEMGSRGNIQYDFSKLERMHNQIINSIKINPATKVNGRPIGTTGYLFNLANRKAKEELRQYSEQLLAMDKPETAPFGMSADEAKAMRNEEAAKAMEEGGIDAKMEVGAAPSRMAAVGPDDFLKTIDSGLNGPEGTSAYYYAKAWDEALKAIGGKDYRKNPDVLKLLSTDNPAGKRFWNDIVYRTTSEGGKEISSPADLLNSLATSGDSPGKAGAEAFKTRRETNKKLPEGAPKEGELSTSDTQTLTESGITPEEFGGGMHIESASQEGQVHDLTYGENRFTPGIAADVQMDPIQAIRAVKGLIFGKDVGFLRQYNALKEKSGKKGFVKDEIFKKLEREAAESLDTQDAMATGAREVKGDLTQALAAAIKRRDAAKRLLDDTEGMFAGESKYRKEIELGLAEAEQQVATLTKELEATR